MLLLARNLSLVLIPLCIFFFALGSIFLCPGAVEIPPIGDRVWATPSLRIGGSARLVRLRPHPFIPFPSSLFFAHHCDLLEPFPRLSTCWLVGLSLFNFTLIFYFFSSLQFGETFL